MGNAFAHGLMTREEEQVLAVRARAGDKRARERLAEGNLRLVASVANKTPSRLPLEDRIGHGFLGLMQAVDGFDPARGFRFTTYAVWWIRRAILRAEMEATPIRLPAHAVDRLHALRKERSRLEAVGEEATLERLAGATGLPVETAGRLLEHETLCFSLDAPRYAGEGKEESVLSAIADRGAANPESLAFAAVERQAALEAMEAAGLTEREREVLIARAGGATLDRVGEAFGVTRERVRQIQATAKKKLARAREAKSSTALLFEGQK